MVHSFFPAYTKSELGWRAGYLGAAFNVGQFFGSIVWGKLSDRFGRRGVMLAGIVGTMLSTLLFGFSSSYWMALVGIDLLSFFRFVAFVSLSLFSAVCAVFVGRVERVRKKVLSDCMPFFIIHDATIINIIFFVFFLLARSLARSSFL